VRETRLTQEERSACDRSRLERRLQPGLLGCAAAHRYRWKWGDEVRQGCGGQ